MLNVVDANLSVFFIMSIKLQGLKDIFSDIFDVK